MKRILAVLATLLLSSMAFADTTEPMPITNGTNEHAVEATTNAAPTTAKHHHHKKHCGKHHHCNCHK